jgi:regulator of RNase E activity RraA
MVDYLKSVDTPTLSNAIELLKLRPHSAGFTPLQIRCLFPEFGRMCGYAVTAQVETATQADPTGREMFVPLFEAVRQSPKPAVVVFQEIGGYRDYAAHCGEVLATVFTRLGAVGLVSDCAVRDIPEVRGLRFHYFARGAVASHAWFRIIRVNVAVQVCGMAVRPGDLLHGDENGLLQVPAEALDRLPAMVDQVRTRERALMDYVRSDALDLSELRSRFFE